MYDYIFLLGCDSDGPALRSKRGAIKTQNNIVDFAVRNSNIPVYPQLILFCLFVSRTYRKIQYQTVPRCKTLFVSEIRKNRLLFKAIIPLPLTNVLID